MESQEKSPAHQASAPPTAAQVEQILRQVAEVLRGPGVLNAEVWFDQERHPERPGRLELPATETLFLRIERLAPARE